MPRPKPPLHALTAREHEIARYLCQGFSNQQIAAALCITPKTLESHIRQIYEKQAEPLQTRGPARRLEFLARVLRGQTDGLLQPQKIRGNP